MSQPAWAVHLPSGVRPADVDLLAEGSLPAAWSARWREAPNRRVLRSDGRWLTRGELDEASAAVAGHLHRAGLERGHRVLLSAASSSAFVTVYCGALRAGYVVVPVNAAYTRRELEVIVRDATPAAALVDSAPLGDQLRAIDPQLLVRDLAELSTPATGSRPSPQPPPALDDLGPSDPALLPYTSGTTGTPKGALLTHGNLLASANAVRLAWRWTADDILILCLPLFHMHGLGVGLHGTLLSGGAAILPGRFEPVTVLAATDEATMFFGVPTMYMRLVDAPDAARLGALRLCVSGSAPMGADLHRRAAAECGQAVLERYGMTETVMLVSNPYDGERRPGTVGLPLPGVELRRDDGGEILVRGPNVFGGYWNRPDATAAAFTDDGWFRTGDVGEFDDAGYLRLVGRTKELIISGGYNVYPREVEDVLRAHPAVADVAVVGTPSDEWGEVVTAYVEAVDDSFNSDALVSWAAGQLAPYKRPRLVHRVEALPRNSLGKVLRGELAPEQQPT